MNFFPRETFSVSLLISLSTCRRVRRSLVKLCGDLENYQASQSGSFIQLMHSPISSGLGRYVGKWLG